MEDHPEASEQTLMFKQFEVKTTQCVSQWIGNLYEIRGGAYGTVTFIDYVKQFIEFLVTEGYEKVYLVMDNLRFYLQEQVRT